MQFYGGHNSKHYLLLNILIATNTHTHTSSVAGYSLALNYHVSMGISVVNTVIKCSEVIEIALV